MRDLLYYEDVELGFPFETGGIVITESHIVEFAGLAGDFFDLHMDDDFARSLGFDRRVAHGLLGLILVDGQKNRASQRFAAVVSLSWQWNFRKPLYVGDRISARVTVEKKRLPKRDDRGTLSLVFEVRNRAGDVIQEGTNPLMVRTRADDAQK